MQIADTTQRWLFFVDNDITVSTSNWLERLACHILECPQAEVHVPKLYNKHESGWGYLADFLVDEAGRCTFLRTESNFANAFPGGASVIDRRLFERLGRYDEDLFVGFEDFEFAIRAAQESLPVLARRADDIVLIHDHRASASQVDKQAAKVRYDLDRITHSHSVIARKHGILLDPNFADWLSEQIHQVTGERPESSAAVSPVPPFVVAGATVTPIHCTRSKVLLLLPLDREPADSFWFRMRAVRQSRQRAKTSNLECHVRALSDRPDPGLRRLLDTSLAEGLIDEWIDARKPDDRLTIGTLDGFDFAAWIGAGLINGDWISRLVQALQFSKQGEFRIAHTSTLLLKVDGREIRLECDGTDPMFDPLGALHRLAFMAASLQWQRFESGYYTDSTSDLSQAARGWLHESVRVGAGHICQPGTMLFLPNEADGRVGNLAKNICVPEATLAVPGWDPWLWFEQRNLLGLTRHYPAMEDWLKRPVIKWRPTITEPTDSLQQLLGQVQVEGVAHMLILPWLRRGGADKAALCYLRALTEHSDRKVIAVTTEPGDSPWDRFVPPGVTLINWPALIGGADESAALDSLLMLILSARVQTVHVINSRLGWQLLRSRGEQVGSVARIYASLFWYGPSPAERLLGYASEFLPDSARYIDSVITDNQRFARQLQQDYGFPQGLFHCVYHPTDRVSSVPIVCRSVGARKRLLWASRFAPEKRLDLLLQIATALPEIEFHLFGDAGHHTAELEVTVTALRELENVRLRGEFDGFSSLPIDEFSAFVYTTSSDGMPNVVVEAMASGLPVIAPMVGGISEVVDTTTGWPIQDENSVPEYIRCIGNMLADPEQAQSRARAALARIEKHHVFDAFVRQLKEVPGYLIR
jgi:glycosyltransferase involved in cell wall biosynthesis